MAARGLSQPEIDRIAANGRALLQKERAAKAPRVVNLDAALQLGQRIPLLWDGTEYTVKSISYREGLHLQRAGFELERMGKEPPATVEGVQAQVAFITETLELFHDLLDPRPPANPFHDASPPEVGELLGFYSWCLMRQGARSPSRMGHRRTTTH